MAVNHWNEFTPHDPQWKGQGLSPLPRKYQVTEKGGGADKRRYPLETSEQPNPDDWTKTDGAR